MIISISFIIKPGCYGFTERGRFDNQNFLADCVCKNSIPNANAIFWILEIMQFVVCIFAQGSADLYYYFWRENDL